MMSRYSKATVLHTILIFFIETANDLHMNNIVNCSEIFNENEIMEKNEKQEDVEKLREWLLLQPHHPKIVDENILLAFVHGCKSLEIAKQKLESFFTWRAQLKDSLPFYNIRDPTDPYFKKSIKSGVLFFLPKDTPEGYKVLFTRPSEQFEEFYDQDQVTACFHMSLELSMGRWPDMKGIFIVWDLKAYKPSFAAKISLPVFETTIRYFQECYPAKMKGVILLNTSPIIETIYNNIFKPFLKDKLRKRITVTKEDSSCLKRFLPEDILPMDYGGKDKTTSDLNDDWMNLLAENKEWLKSNALLVADESKRPPNTKPSFGVEGNFRALSID